MRTRIGDAVSSARLADPFEQGHRVDIEAIDPPIGTDETQAIRRQAQRPWRAVRIMQGQCDARSLWARLVHTRRTNGQGLTKR